MRPSLSLMFETPLVVDTLPHADAANLVLSEAITDMVRSPGPLSATALHGRAGQALRHVCDHVVRLADGVTRDDAARHESRYRWQSDIRVDWLDGGSTGLHPAPRYEAFWIAQYHIVDGYHGSADRSLGGEIEIDDPRLPAPMMESPDLRLRLTQEADGAFYEPSVRLRPAAGRMLLYPGWLRTKRQPLAVGTRALWLTIALVEERIRN